MCTHNVECVWNLMAHGDARVGKWRGNWRIEWVANTLTLPRNVVYPALLSLMGTPRLPAVDWRPCRFQWTRPFRRKTKSGFCACAITFKTQSIIEGRSCNRRWSGKAISITYSEYESVALGIQHPMRVCRIVIGGLSGCTIFFNIV
jgi:hypothetical protein